MFPLLPLNKKMPNETILLTVIFVSACFLLVPNTTSNTTSFLNNLKVKFIIPMHPFIVIQEIVYALYI